VVVAPLMLVELGAAIWIAIGGLAPTALAWTGLALLALLWGSTFAVQVPLHARLTRGFDGAAHARLVATNALRTALWSIRGVGALAMLA